MVSTAGWPFEMMPEYWQDVSAALMLAHRAGAYTSKPASQEVVLKHFAEAVFSILLPVRVFEE